MIYNFRLDIKSYFDLIKVPKDISGAHVKCRFSMPRSG
jgi:hypothetical protein